MFRPGVVLRFNYDGVNARDHHPRVLVLGEKDGLLHGLNLKYMTITDAERLRDVLRVDNLRKILSTDDPIGFITRNMKSFYDSYLRRHINDIPTSCYRTYVVNKISSAMEVDDFCLLPSHKGVA
jgi:hypothetical protein